jgi:carboxymethylenebutenolidase
MSDDIRSRAIQIYDEYTHDHCDRRTLLREMTLLMGSAVAAEALIAGIAASPAAAQQTSQDDVRLGLNGKVSLNGLEGYIAAPAAYTGRAGVMVIHENRGLNEHIKDVTRRLALEGFVAFAPDLLFPVGGTPANEDEARSKINALDLSETVTRGFNMLKTFRSTDFVTYANYRAKIRRVGVVGFCWGGGMVNRLAVASGIVMDAGVAYYGPAPSPAEAVRVKCPLMLHYAGNDARVNATGEPWVAALKAEDKEVEAFTYPGVDHAFNNNTSAERYNAAAAGLAWNRTVKFLKKNLG